MIHFEGGVTGGRGCVTEVHAAQLSAEPTRGRTLSAGRFSLTPFHAVCHYILHLKQYATWRDGLREYTSQQTAMFMPVAVYRHTGLSSMKKTSGPVPGTRVSRFEVGLLESIGGKIHALRIRRVFAHTMGIHRGLNLRLQKSEFIRRRFAAASFF